MTNITLYALFILRDGELETSFSYTEDERNAALRSAMVDASRALGRSALEFHAPIELEEFYEQTTGKQLEFICKDVTLPASHPALMQVQALIETALADLKSSTSPPYVAISYLKKAIQLMHDDKARD